jgi:uncharacterized protein (UPF0332 family)
LSPEAGHYLDTARKLLADGETMLGVGLNEAAGRNAYLAGFHAAQAFLFDGLGKVFKSHHGAPAEPPSSAPTARWPNGRPRLPWTV